MSAHERGDRRINDVQPSDWLSRIDDVVRKLQACRQLICVHRRPMSAPATRHVEHWTRRDGVIVTVNE
jgi:hypothetical protein